ncbi:hypothetical protein DFA_00399 [Cavenderia fasciculata]|uniref:Crossover junction endonuclease MUS81 n=1 Tax=Cavenderia fasciculata TaxID=261658 RepID=F4PRN9_CACFS|nr:uncharacterized protein DFA_00399 [Cavenderia fasciculata]EGG20538.1 hypothetical protein DFA_00399 [Cavenderia fasciculata]|eukprot:XP_004358388.1 hypothetical protein DFA_00399 [Cavenderia fasciculata]
MATVSSNQYLIAGLEAHRASTLSPTMARCYSRLINSVKSYPLPITIDEIESVSGIGRATGKILRTLIENGPLSSLSSNQQNQQLITNNNNNSRGELEKQKLKERLEKINIKDLFVKSDDFLAMKRPNSFAEWIYSIKGITDPTDIIDKFNLSGINQIQHIPLIDGSATSAANLIFGQKMLVDHAVTIYKRYDMLAIEYAERGEDLETALQWIKGEISSNDGDDDIDNKNLFFSDKDGEDILISTEGPPPLIQMQYIETICSKNVLKGAYEIAHMRKLADIHLGSDNIIKLMVSPSGDDNVQGRGDKAYEVIITLDPDRKMASRCSCTCEYGKIHNHRKNINSSLCKHIIAPLLILSQYNQQNNSQNNSNQNSQNNQNNQNNNNSTPRRNPTRPRNNNSIYLQDGMDLELGDEDEYIPPEDKDDRDYSPTRDKQSRKRSSLATSTNNGSQQENDQKRTRRRSTEQQTTDKSTNNNNSKKNRYRPKYRSGAWGLLMALYAKLVDEENSKDGLSKNELVMNAQEYSDAQFSTDGGWRSMKTLEDHQLVSEYGKPKIFKLTKMGWDIARKLYSSKPTGTKNITMAVNSDDDGDNDDNDNDDNDNDDYDIHSQQDNEDSPTKTTITTTNEDFNQEPSPPPLSMEEQVLYDWSDDSDSETIHWLVDRPFPITHSDVLKIKKENIYIREVVLLVDNREIKNHRKNGDSLLQLLNTVGVKYEQRALPLGDFLWITRLHYNLDEEQTVYEMVMDTIIERKKIPDLLESIKDGRYKDQKYRLTRCGIDKTHYLIEGQLNYRTNGGGGGGSGSQDTTVTPKDPDDEKVYQSISETFLEDEIIPVRTKSEEDTVHMLRTITTRMTDNPHIYFSDMCYDEFADRATHEPMTITSMFACMLLTIRGMTEKKATQIITEYPTLHRLITKYRRMTTVGEAERLLADYVGVDLNTPAANIEIFYILTCLGHSSLSLLLLLYCIIILDSSRSNGRKEKEASGYKQQQ